MSRRIRSQKSAGELIEIFPYGLAAGVEQGRPVLLFQDAEEKVTLPVWVSSAEAAVSVAQHYGQSSASSPHQLSGRILAELGLKVERCVFREVKGYHQFVDVEFSGHPHLRQLRSRADQCLSFCLNEQARFYCTRAFIRQCQDQDAELADLSDGALLHPDLVKNHHPYMN